MKKQQLAPYPAYKPSGVEWLGDIPAHWEVKRLKHLARVNPDSLPETTNPDHEMEYIDIGGVSSLGQILERERLRFGAAPSRARRMVREGDVIVSTVRTYLRAIAAIAGNDTNTVVSTGFAVIRPTQGLSSRFAAYALRAPYFIDRVVAASKGVSFPAISESEMTAFVLSVPPLPEQHAIAVFLDRETARIDEMVARKERLIALLQEKRTALITRAVTKGLDPNVPMKDSGVEWLGEIPAHWEAETNRWLFRESDKRSGAGDEELMTVSHITGVTRRSAKPEVTMIEAESHEGYKLCGEGELVVNTMWAWMGALGVADEAGMVSPSYNVYRLDRDRLLPRYYDRLCRIPLHVTEIIRHSKGIWQSRLRLYPDEFLELRTPLPPIDEQRSIVTYISAESQKLDSLVIRIREAIGGLHKRRAALISAAVTGQIDVREAAA